MNFMASTFMIQMTPKLNNYHDPIIDSIMKEYITRSAFPDVPGRAVGAVNLATQVVTHDEEEVNRGAQTDKVIAPAVYAVR